MNSDKAFQSTKMKKTEARISVFDVLNVSEEPLTIEDIHTKISKLYKSKKIVKKPDLVTVYRTLDTFEKAGVAKKVLFKDKKTRYELSHGHDGHCHHAVCSSCGKTEHVDDPAIEKALTNLSKKFKIVTQVHEHVLEFFGLCISCKNKTYKIQK